MKKQTGVRWFFLVLAVALAGGAWAQGARSQRPAASGGARRAAKPAASASRFRGATVAIVGGQPIARATLEERVRLAEENYRERTGTMPGSDDLPILKRQVLEGLIREKLLVLEARRRGMSLTAAQAEEEVKKDPFFQTGGMFDEAKFLAIKSGQPDRFRSVVAEIQNTMPAIRLRERLIKENAPDSTALRARIASQLSTVRLQYLALRRADFLGETTPPSEAEVIAYYRSHAAEFHRPEQARVSVLTVNQPPLDANLGANEPARKAWEARMERQADSLLAALRRGAPLEGVAPLYGGLRTEKLQRDRFPRYWTATGRSREEVFSSPEGTLLPSLPAADGRIIVRVDEHVAEGTAPLRDVAVSIRTKLATSRAEATEDRELRALYAAVKDSLRGPAYRVRYAVADTATFPVPEPSGADLDRYYRGHQADYATLDRATTSVVTVPMAQVRGDVRRRLLQERRNLAARDAAAELLQAWAAGKRDPRLEKLMATKEVGPLPPGGLVDASEVGRVLSDSLAQAKHAEAGVLPSTRGPVVYQIHDRVNDYLPSFEASRPLLVSRLGARHAAEEEAAAKALFERHPERIPAAKVVAFSRLMVPPPTVFEVPLSRQEVEGWYRNHIDHFGSPELSRVRHILIVPKGTTQAADAAAKQLADEVMKRLRAGDDFGALALRYSDDEETRGQGGDVGVFRPGMMLPDFERIVFNMEPGDRRGPVRTDAGYEIVECLLHVPAEETPLKYCYANVAVEAARAKGQRMARFRADSLRRTIHSIPQAQALAKQLGVDLYRNQQVVGTPMPSDMQDYIHRVERTPPGTILPDVQEYVGMGYAITWVDSVMPPRRPSWNEARERMISMLRDDRARDRMSASRAELDSLLHAGWSFDSVAAVWGGPEEVGPAGPDLTLPKLGGTAIVDSLAFGTKGKAPVLRPLAVSDWVELPGGFVRLRLMERHPPDPAVLGARFVNDYQAELERKFRSVFEQMRQRFPVEILDPDLKLVDLPSLEAS